MTVKKGEGSQGCSAIEQKLKVLILTHFGRRCAIRGAPARDPGSSACQNSSERRIPFVDATSGVTAVAPEGGTFKDGRQADTGRIDGKQAKDPQRDS